MRKKIEREALRGEDIIRAATVAASNAIAQQVLTRALPPPDDSFLNGFWGDDGFQGYFTAGDAVGSKVVGP